MAEQIFQHMSCPLIILRVAEKQVTGEAMADRLRDEFLAAYEGSGAVNAILDLAKVAYVSSIGLRPLLGLNRIVREKEGRLILCNLSEAVAGVLTAAQLIKPGGSSPAAFETQSTLPEAIAHLELDR
jgi:anti-anti-sigma factor